ncbi:flippase [Priestia megaterium]|uniref:flippase n=1 Tax=Priestia megaterium TaxID=1404 RepID=UPI00207ABA55|nr:flippase [Priestia megaterium]USL25728.1 flippase [Priestia megaterium]
MNFKKDIKLNKFTNNTIWLILEKVFQLFLGLFVGVWTARYLGPTNFGILNYGASLIAFFTVICSLGLENVIIKYFINDPKKSNTFLFSAILMRLIVSLISIVIIYIIVSAIHYNEQLIITVITLQSLALIFQSFDTIDYWFQSKLMSKYVVLGKSIARLVVSIWKIYLLASGASLEFFALSSTIEAIVVSFVLGLFYFKLNNVKISFSKKHSKALLLDSYHFILSGLLVSLFTQIDKIMIANLIGQSSVGVFSVAANIAVLWYFVPLAVINSARPVILDNKKESNLKYEDNLKKLYAFIIWIGVFVSLVVTLLSYEIIHILYGTQYLKAAAPLAILTWSSVFSLLGSARNIWIVSENANKYTKYFFLMGIIVNFLLNYIFIGLFGIVGAAIATLMAQITTTIIAPLLFAKTKKSTQLMVCSVLLIGLIFKSKN